MSAVDGRDGLYQRYDAVFRDSGLQQKTCLRLTSKPSGHINVVARFGAAGSGQKQSHILNQMATAGCIRFESDLEFFRQPLKTRITGEVVLEPSCQVFQLRESCRSLAAAGNTPHRTSAGPTRSEPDSGKMFFDGSQVFLTEPVDLHAAAGSQVNSALAEAFGNQADHGGLLGRDHACRQLDPLHVEAVLSLFVNAVQAVFGAGCVHKVRPSRHGCCLHTFRS